MHVLIPYLCINENLYLVSRVVVSFRPYCMDVLVVSANPLIKLEGLA